MAELEIFYKSNDAKNRGCHGVSMEQNGLIISQLTDNSIQQVEWRLELVSLFITYHTFTIIH